MADVEGGASAGERVFKRGLRERLQAAVQRRRDGDVFVDGANRIVERIHHVIGGVIGGIGVLIADGLRGMGEGERRHRIGDKALLPHRLDDLRRALGGAFRIVIGGKARRRLHQSGENGGFG